MICSRSRGVLGHGSGAQCQLRSRCRGRKGPPRHEGCATKARSDERRDLQRCRRASKLGSGICVTAGSGRSRGWSPLSVKDIAVRVTSSNSRQSYNSSERSRLLRRSASCASRSVGIRDRNMSPPEILPRPQKRGTGIGSA